MQPFVQEIFSVSLAIIKAVEQCGRSACCVFDKKKRKEKNILPNANEN
jgi:hypothetical protein